MEGDPYRVPMGSVTAKLALSNINKHLEQLLRETVLPITLFNQLIANVE
jgi:hypothetical protein